MKKIFIPLLLLPAFTFAQKPGDVSSNLQLWLKATAGTTASTDGNLVSSWTDQSGTPGIGTGTTKVAAQSAPDSMPVFRNNALDNVNYNPVIDFDGSKSALNLGSNYIFSSGTGTENGMTWLAVVQSDATPTTKLWPFIFDIGFFANHAYGMSYGSNTFTIHTSHEDGGVESNGNSHSFSTQPVIANFTIDFSTTRQTAASGDGNQTFSVNGGSPLITNTIGIDKLTAAEISENPTPTLGSGPFSIGRQSKNGGLETNNDRLFDGSIAELIGFNRVLTAAELKRVESYLAIKHGTTLSNAGGGTNGDYHATNSVVIWNANENSGAYHNQVVGIGHDDNNTTLNTGLVQKQSHTLDDTTRIYISSLAATNSANAGAFTLHRSYVVTGNNGGAMKSMGSTEYPAGIVSRIDREWAVRNTNFPGTFSMDFKLNTSSITASDLRLLVDEDGNGDFSNASVYASGANGITISYDNSSKVITVSGLSNTLFPHATTRQITLASASENTPLPATFQEVVAFLKSGRLTVNWTTTCEVNNDYFEIETSADGKTFFKTGEAKSSAQEGCASSPTSYSFTKTITGSAITGISFFALALGGLLKHRKRMALVLGAIAIAALFYACTKSTDTLITDKHQLFVRIIQVDKDGNKTYSKAVKAAIY